MYICDSCPNKGNTQACDWCKSEHDGFETFKEENENGGKKHDMDKRRMDLVDYHLLDDLADVLTFGANKYGDNNWKKVETERYKAALVRHISSYMQGKEVDEESGLHHLSHAACNIMFLKWKERENA